jgi:hypothetical protein
MYTRPVFLHDSIVSAVSAQRNIITEDGLYVPPTSSPLFVPQVIPLKFFSFQLRLTLKLSEIKIIEYHYFKYRPF